MLLCPDDTADRVLVGNVSIVVDHFAWLLLQQPGSGGSVGYIFDAAGDQRPAQRVLLEDYRSVGSEVFLPVAPEASPSDQAAVGGIPVHVAPRPGRGDSRVNDGLTDHTNAR